MKPKELVLDMDESCPKFVEKTLDISTTPIDPEPPLKTSKILENDQPSDLPIPTRNDVQTIEPPTPENNDHKIQNIRENVGADLATTLIKEDVIDEKPKEDKQENQESDWKDELRRKARMHMEFFLEYFTGFMIGMSMSLLGYRFVKFVNKKSRTRKGLFAGCMVSFVLIFMLCIFYMTYTRNVLIDKRKYARHHRSMRHFHTQGFSHYLSDNISAISQGVGSALSTFLPHFSYTHARHRRMHLKTQRKIKALRHMQRKIHRHLRLLL